MRKGWREQSEVVMPQVAAEAYHHHHYYWHWMHQPHHCWLVARDCGASMRNDGGPTVNCSCYCCRYDGGCYCGDASDCCGWNACCAYFHAFHLPTSSTRDLCVYDHDRCSMHVYCVVVLHHPHCYLSTMIGDDDQLHHHCFVHHDHCPVVQVYHHRS